MIFIKSILLLLAVVNLVMCNTADNDKKSIKQDQLIATHVVPSKKFNGSTTTTNKNVAKKELIQADEGKFLTLSSNFDWDQLLKDLTTTTTTTTTTRRPRRPSRPTRWPSWRPPPWIHPTPFPTPNPTPRPTPNPTPSTTTPKPKYQQHPYEHLAYADWPYRIPFGYPVPFPPPPPYWENADYMSNHRNYPKRRRTSTTKAPETSAYNDQLYSPINPASFQPFYTTAIGSSQLLPATTNSVLNQPHTQDISATSKPLYVSTPILNSPSALSLSSASSSTNSGGTSTIITKMPVMQLSQIDFYGSTTTENVVPNTAMKPSSSTNQHFCNLFHWICDSNSEIHLAQIQNSNSGDSPYIVLLVNPPSPTPVTYMKSIE